METVKECYIRVNDRTALPPEECVMYEGFEEEAESYDDDVVRVECSAAPLGAAGRTMTNLAYSLNTPFLGYNNLIRGVFLF